MEFSQIILNHMEAMGVTGYKLSKETGISESLFGKWRKNPTSKIDATTLVKISNFFGVTIDELLELNTKKEPFAKKGLGLSKEAQSLFNLFDLVPNENKALILNMIESALKSQGLLK